MRDRIESANSIKESIVVRKYHDITTN